MNGAPGNNLNSQPNVRESITDEIARIIEESSKTPFPKSLEVATAEVLGRRQREKWKEERKHTDEEPTTQLFPLKETDEFKTFVNKSLTAKTLDEMLAVIEKYEKIPVKIFDSGEIDEVDGKAMKGMIEKYLEDANFTQENTESYSFDINGIELFKGKLSGLLAREIEKRGAKEEIPEEKKSTLAETSVPQETHLPENLPLETPLVLVNEAVGTPEEPTVEKIDHNLFAVKRSPFAFAVRLINGAKRAGKAFIALQDKIEAEHDNQIGVPPKKDSSVSSNDSPTTTDYTKPTTGNGIRFSVIPETPSSLKTKSVEVTDFEPHNENLIDESVPPLEVISTTSQSKEQEVPIKSVLRRNPPEKAKKTNWFRKLFSKKDSKDENIDDYGEGDPDAQKYHKLVEGKEHSTVTDENFEKLLKGTHPTDTIHRDYLNNKSPVVSLANQNRKEILAKIAEIEAMKGVPTLTDEELKNDSTFDNPEPFVNSLYNKEDSITVSPEKLKEVERKLEVVENKTKSLRKSLMEKLGNSGKELLSLADRGAKFFGENVDWKTKVFAGAGLVAAGALSAYATPVVLTAIGVTSLALRGLSAASTYLVLKGILDKKYEVWEKEGKTTSDIKKVMYGTGAAILAGVTGQAVGWLAENGLSSLKDMVSGFSPSSIPLTDVAPSPAVDVVTPDVSAPVIATVETPPLSPEIIHEVAKGQNLWSILRSTLSKENIGGFLSLTQGEQEARIQALVAKIAEDPKSFGVSSEKVDLIRVGEKLNLTSLFKK